LLALGASYDFLFGDKMRKTNEGGETMKIRRENAMHRITLAGAFVANAYSTDQIIFGLEYSLLDYFQVRGGYTLESTIFDKNTSFKSNFTGPAVGSSILIPLKKGGTSPSRLAIDYSYRFTDEYRGSHAIGARLIL